MTPSLRVHWLRSNPVDALPGNMHHTGWCGRQGSLNWSELWGSVLQALHGKSKHRWSSHQTFCAYLLSLPWPQTTETLPESHGGQGTGAPTGERGPRGKPLTIR